MPEIAARVDVSSGEDVELVAPRDTVTGLSCIFPVPGLAYYVRHGKNDWVGPYTGKNTWYYGDAVTPEDVQFGVWVRPARAVPNAEMVFQVSFGPSLS